MKIKAHEAGAFIGKLKPDTAPALIVVYGHDQGGVHETVMALKAAYLGTDFDPLQYVTLDETALSGQAGLLADEAGALPMFGEHKLVHMVGGGGNVGEAAKIYLSGLPEKNSALVIIESGNLRPSAALRKFAESDKNAMAIPCYALDARDISRLARSFLEQENYRIDAQALDLLCARLTTDRGIIQRELERLVLFKGVLQKGESGLISADDIDAGLGDQTQGTLDELVDHIALGRVGAADKALARLNEAGTNMNSILVMARLHFQTLHLALGLMEGGEPQAKALTRFRPPLHFKRKPLVEEQMRLWSSAKAARALQILNDTERACRGSAPSLAAAKTGNALLRIAGAARR